MTAFLTEVIQPVTWTGRTLQQEVLIIFSRDATASFLDIYILWFIDSWPDHFFDKPTYLNFFFFLDFGTDRRFTFFSFTSWNLAFQNWVFTKK